MLALGLIIDAFVGEPDWLWRRVPHPVVLAGWVIEALEARLNQAPWRRARGAAAVAAMVLAAGLIGWVLSLEVFRGVFEVIGVVLLVAHRGLVDHVNAVATGLETSLDVARAEVSRIVGRDPDTLDEAGVARAAIESAAENFSDGVVAPAFWFLVAGLPGIAVYKAVNTADSMIGHRNERYRDFSWAAARLDDLLNWIPARLTGLLICLVGGGREAMQVMLRDAPDHRSPNAGWPEAAMAASLGLAIAGPRVYGGVLTADPFMNAGNRTDAGPEDIRAATRLAWRAWAVVLAVAVLAAFLGR